MISFIQNIQCHQLFKNFPTRFWCSSTLHCFCICLTSFLFKMSIIRNIFVGSNLRENWSFPSTVTLCSSFDPFKMNSTFVVFPLILSACEFQACRSFIAFQWNFLHFLSRRFSSFCLNFPCFCSLRSIVTSYVVLLSKISSSILLCTLATRFSNSFTKRFSASYKMKLHWPSNSSLTDSNAECLLIFNPGGEDNVSEPNSSSSVCLTYIFLNLYL